jgi:hypothetical protein
VQLGRVFTGLGGDKTSLPTVVGGGVLAVPAQKPEVAGRRRVYDK